MNRAICVYDPIAIRVLSKMDMVPISMPELEVILSVSLFQRACHKISLSRMSLNHGREIT